MISKQLETYLQQKKELVEQTLDRLLPSNDEEPRVIHQSMRYSVLAGGKRLRPILAIAAHEIAGGTGEAIFPIACGLELIHTYSLIHDDLPCMDDDDLRRGLPTNHKVFGEGIAVLAGDALLTLAFECFLGRGQSAPPPLATLGRLAHQVSRAIGSKGLVGGQVMDISDFSRDRQIATLETTCYFKTGRLFEVSLEVGAILAEADDAIVQALKRYGRSLGLAFQIVDDILNVTGDPNTLGKTVHSDAVKHKVTFADLLGLDAARQEAEKYIQVAKTAVASLSRPVWFLEELADFVLQRRS